MSQLPYLKHDELDEDGRATWDAVVSTRGERVITPEGTLSGPFNALLHAPGVGLRVSDLGAALRFHSSLEPRLLELAVMVVAAHWHAEYEWAAHAKLAGAAGISDDVVNAIADGKQPALDADDQKAVYAAAKEIVETGHATGGTYDAVHALLGDTGTVELVFLCGYYTLVSFGLNVFDVPLGPGDSPRWP